MKYLFGDTDLAARRLAMLADVFAASSRPFLVGTGARRPRLAVDLGCGPGHTTLLLAEALECERTVGLDSSEHFIALANRTASATVSFQRHDVTTAPFPVGPCDLAYCRFLLTHLADPNAAVAGWATQLEPGGLLLLEETEWIETDVAAFARYVGIVEAMLAHQGNELYVGRRLDGLANVQGLRKRSGAIGRLCVENARTATMFLMNMQTWKRNAFVRNSYSAESLAGLEGELLALSEQSTGEARIEWGLRQVVFERR